MVMQIVVLALVIDVELGHSFSKSKTPVSSKSSTKAYVMSSEPTKSVIGLGLHDSLIYTEL